MAMRANKCQQRSHSENKCSKHSCIFIIVLYRHPGYMSDIGAKWRGMDNMAGGADKFILVTCSTWILCAEGHVAMVG